MFPKYESEILFYTNAPGGLRVLSYFFALFIYFLNLYCDCMQSYIILYWQDFFFQPAKMCASKNSIGYGI